MCRHVHGFSLLFFFAFFPMVLSQLPENQRNTMIKLSAVIKNTNSSHWNTTEENPCSWKGVTCTNNNSSITHLSLSGFDISSSDFLTILCEINSLESLDVSKNFLTSIPDGFIRDCGKIDGLKMLNFSVNRLSGFLPAFHGFSRLQFLDLANNELGGNIDIQLDGLVGMVSLNLSYNHFSGSIPTNLGKAMVLEELQLSNNNFRGPIPEELMGYTNLTLLDLSINELSGSVSNRIGELSKLKTLLLSANDFEGGIPENLSRIETLSQFRAYLNRFTGRIPPGISRSLKILDLSYNELNGSIPSDLMSQVNLQWVDLSYNSLGGSIPSNISQSLFRLRLGSNSLQGVIPNAAVEALLNLTYLELDNNGLSGEIPPALGRCQSLALLNLAGNQLKGGLPIQLGNLLQLQVLKLQSNLLVGEIPHQLFQLENLTVLNISKNSLTGSIPSAISNLTKLANLNLCDNKLSGSIPDSIVKWNSLLELQLGNNMLSGNIPRMPQSLKIALNLSTNQFDGSIPETLNGLNGLEVLDLSNNKFTGQIPTFLTKMESLILLLLFNNQLSGTLPQFPQRSIFVNTTGNNDLNFIASTPPNPTLTSPKKRNAVVKAVIIGVAVAAFFVGVMGLFLLLVLRRFYKINNENPQVEEQLSHPQVISYHMITANSTHKSSIDFTRAMEAVGNRANVMLKSKFSTYYKAIMPCGTSYYVKKLNWSDKIFQLGSHEKFGEELEVLGKINNSNVMTPLAYVLTSDIAYLFYEYTEKGTLFDVLHGSLGNVLDWASRYSIAIGIAQGLAFLHGGSASPVLLLDLSTKTILLKSLTEPQIGDIELCKVIDPSKSTGSLSTVAGSVGYIPPEYAYTMRVTMPGNVYSFGVILLELLTGRLAVSEGTELAKWVLSNSKPRGSWDQILDSTVSNTSPGIKSQMLLVLKVALACVSVSPEARPKMKNVLRMLLNAR